MILRFAPKLGIALAITTALTFGSAYAQSTTVNVLRTDQEFVPNAVHDGAMEVRDAQLAQARGVSAAVKEYAAMMLADYGAANTQLASIAQAKNYDMMAVPTVVAAASDTTVVTRDTKVSDMVVRTPAPYGVGGRMPPDRGFEQETGPAFDRSYMRYEIQQHLIDIALFADEAATGKDADLVALAQGMLPKLYAELNAAQRFMGVPETPMPAPAS